MTAQLLAVILSVSVIAISTGIALAWWLRMRGTRVVVCPETAEPAAVEVDAAHAAVTALVEKPDIRLKDCSRWPERAGCEQPCVAQIADAPTETRASDMLKRWYFGKHCAICRRDIAPMHLAGPQPGLLNVASHQTVAWPEIPGQDLPGALKPTCRCAQTARSLKRSVASFLIW